MICQFCGCEHDVTKLLADELLHGNPDTYICSQCLRKAFYCADCKKVAVGGMGLGNHRLCICCAGTRSICKHCGNLCSSSEDYCEDCSSKLQVCSVCGEQHIITKSTTTGEPICVTCTAPLSQCPCCKSFHTEQGVTGLCAKCQENSVLCAVCGCAILKGLAVKFNKRLGYICPSHIASTPCSSCSKKRKTIAHVTARGEERSSIRVCGPCHQRNEIGHIYRYGYKPDTKFHGTGPLYFGIENEVSFDGNVSTLSACHKLQHADDAEDWWYIKSDSSVHHGFEIVTQAMSFEYIKSTFPINTLFNTVPFINHSSCGMHIHMDKAAFTNAQLYKFLSFVSNNPEFIEKVAERTSNHYCRKLDKSTLVRKAADKNGEDRDAINLRPAHTVEVRIFRGTTTPSQFLKNVEFCHALYMFTKIMGVSSLTEDKFKEFIQKEPQMYCNLITFLNLN